MVLTGKVGVVTGAAGNLGLAAARLFLEQGARVMLVDKDASSLRAALERLESNRASSAIADVTRASDVEAYAAATEKAFGKIDLFFEGEFTRFADLDVHHSGDD